MVLFRPVEISLSIDCHESAPQGRVPSYVSASTGSFDRRPQQKVYPLGVLIVGANDGFPAFTGSFLIPYARALCSQSMKKSALDIFTLLKVAYELGFCLALLRAVNVAFMIVVYFQSPLFAEFVRLNDPSHPPIQSWKAARTNLRISIPLVGLTKNRESIVLSITPIVAGVITVTLQI